MSVKLQVLPVTILNKGTQIAMRVGRIPCELTLTKFKWIIVQ